MAKSKRSSVLLLNKVEKKGKETKVGLIQKIRDLTDQYQSIYLFECENFRTSFLKTLRETLKESKFFMGKNKVIMHAIGSDESTEIKPKIAQLTPFLVGNVGLLFSNLPLPQLESFFNENTSEEYARPGFKPTTTVELEAGPLIVIGAPEPYPMSHTQEAYLRSLGMDTQLKNGVVSLTKKFIVCKEGEPLTVNQANILRALEVKLATSCVKLLALYNAEDGSKSFKRQIE